MKQFLIVIIFPIYLLILNSAQAANDEFKRKSPTPVADFELVNQHGESFNLDKIKGHWSMLVLGFTSCPDVCPMTLFRLEAIRAQLGMRVMPDHIPSIIFIAVDTERDEPILKDYLAHFHPDYIGLTGNESELNNLVGSIGGIYRIEKRYKGDRDYNVKHSTGVALINPEGQWVATLNPPFHSHRTSEFLVQLMRDSKSDQATQHARN